MATKKYSKIVLLTLSAALLFSACNMKKKATGISDLIYVVADSSEYYQLEPTLIQVFGKIIYTPQPENLFNLKRISVNNLEKYKDRKNILFIAPLNSGSHTSEYLNSILGEKVKKMVADSNRFVVIKPDLWAREQMVMYLFSPTIEQLKKNILSDADNLLYQFQHISDERLFNKLYYPQYEKKDIEAKLLKEYGWVIYVQPDFWLAKDAPEDNFVWLRRAPGSDMERWIFVHWIDDASPSFLDADSIAAERNRITAKFYRTSDDSSCVEIADQYLNSSEVNFEGRYAIMTQGLLRMKDKSMGGPFVNYTFYDEATKRVYMLDGSIYAPKYYKKKLIQQVDVMLHSFKTKKELSKNRIDELMDELKDE
ncbi:MAG: DUF4837 family protein [Chlorobi bacterium]|nr:DUF4837 family protein [Chlorobiota bacterium]